MTNPTRNLALPRETPMNGRKSLPLAVLLGALLLGAVVFNSFDFTKQSSANIFEPDWQIYLRLGICGLCGLYGLFYLPRTFREYGSFPGAWGLLFVVWSLVTVLFAQDFTYAAAAAVALVCMLLFAPAVLWRLGGRGVAIAILTALVLYLLGSWFKYFAMPEIGRMAFGVGGDNIIYRLGGNAQELGIQAAWTLAFILLLAGSRSLSWKWLFLPLVLVAITLPFTQSRTGMLAAAAVVVLMLLRRMTKQNILIRGVAVTTAVCILATFAILSGVGSRKIDYLLSKATRTGSATEIYHMTGRTEIWAFSLTKIRQAPLQGHGYGSARHALADARDVSGYQPNELHHAHNLFLNVILCTGIIGGLLLLAMVCDLLLAMWRRPAGFPDVALVVVLLAGIAEPMLFGPMPRLHTMVWFIALFWRQLDATLDGKTSPAISSDRVLATDGVLQENDPRLAGATT